MFGQRKTDNDNDNLQRNNQQLITDN